MTARRVGTGWQTIIADLSMILFMLMASVVARTDGKAHLNPALAPASVSLAKAPPRPAPRSDPVAVWIAGEGAPPLDEWLAQQPRDSRQQVTITATYAPGAMQDALQQAQALSREAGDARVVVEPGASGEPGSMRVVIGYDAPEARLAQPLQDQGQAISKDHP